MFIFLRFLAWISQQQGQQQGQQDRTIPLLTQAFA
jgi:hypothetical protein